MAAAFFTLLIPAPGASAAEKKPKMLAPSVIRRMNRIQENVGSTLFGRRLITLAQGVPRRSWGLREAPFLYIPGVEPFFAVDPEKLAGLSDREAELAFVRELARAGFSLPVEMPEIEMAAYQIEMHYALLKAESDSSFKRDLKRRLKKRARDGRKLKAYLRLRSRMGEGAEKRSVHIPLGEMERLSYFMYLFSEGPDEFYWGVDQGLGYTPAAVRLTELKDFIDRLGPSLREITVPAGALYVRIGGRRYPAALLRAARIMTEYGGVERLDEVLADFDIKTPESLLKKVSSFITARD